MSLLELQIEIVWSLVILSTNPFCSQTFSLLWKHLLLKALLDTPQQGAYCSWDIGSNPLADVDGNRLDQVAFQNYLMLAVWHDCLHELMNKPYLNVMERKPHSESCGTVFFFYFSRVCGDPGRRWFPTTLDQCWILKDLAEWHTVSFTWKQGTFHCLICLYRPAAEYWRWPCRPQVVQDHTVRDHGLSLLCFPDWFTLISSVLVYVLCIQT